MSSYWWTCPDCGDQREAYGDNPVCHPCNPVCEICGDTARFAVHIIKGDIVHRFCGGCVVGFFTPLPRRRK